MPGPWSEWTAEAVATAARGTLISGRGQALFTGLSTDSRNVGRGELFAALVGERFDGHDFVLKALEKGAGGMLVGEAWWRHPGRQICASRPQEAAVIVVADTLRALGDLANGWRHQNRALIVAVTGSAGKTSTKEMAAGILQRRHSTLKTEGNLNNLIGLPLTLLRMDRVHERGVLEMGMNRTGEILRLTEIAEPDVGLITNVGKAHLEGLGTLEAIARAKVELLEGMAPEGRAVLNGDDGLLMKTAAPFPRPSLCFGLGPHNDVRAEGIVQHGQAGVAFELCYGGHRWPVRLRVPGLHQVMNALGAAAAALGLGEGPEDVVAGLEAFRGLHGRFHVRSLGDGIVLVDDTYNANPASLGAGLLSLRGLVAEGGRIIVGLGDMLELGEEAAAAHREAGRRVAEIRASDLFVLGAYAHRVVEGALAGGMSEAHVAKVKDQEEMAERVVSSARKGDLVYIKGSRRMGLEKTIEALAALLGEEPRQ